MRNFLAWASGRSSSQRNSSASERSVDDHSPSADAGAAQAGQSRSRGSRGGLQRPRAGRSSASAGLGRGGVVVAKDDPLRLDSSLFEYVTHRTEHGEVFVAYRVRGHPMILHSLVDGLPLASLHLRPAPSRNGTAGNDVRALVSRRPGKGEGEFLGILSADNQDFEVVMTNLTTDTVMMFDIGGVARKLEDAFWEKTDASFWSGQHRNDRRLNRSNIVWPMTPNVCSENNFYFQDHGEHRRLVLRAKAPIGGGSTSSTNNGRTKDDPGSPGNISDPSAVEEGFPVFVYPKHGSRTADKFTRTAWSCPETILVVGTPSLLDGDFREGHNIQMERPRPAPAGQQPPKHIADEVAASFGVPTSRLCEVCKIDLTFLESLPRDMQVEAMHSALQSADLSALEDEPPAVPKSTSSSNNLPLEPSTMSGSSLLPDGEEDLGLGAKAAEVAAGRRLLREGAHSLLIERFEFERVSAHAVVTLGVRDGLQLCDPAEATAKAEAEEALATQLARLIQTRAAELTEDMQASAVYSTPECVICMESFPEPDTVLYQCGHRCVHMRCIESARLRRCPLCRSPIVALLPDGAVGDAKRLSAEGFESEQVTL